VATERKVRTIDYGSNPRISIRARDMLRSHHEPGHMLAPDHSSILQMFYLHKQEHPHMLSLGPPGHY